MVRRSTGSNKVYTQFSINYFFAKKTPNFFATKTSYAKKNGEGERRAAQPPTPPSPSTRRS